MSKRHGTARLAGVFDGHAQRRASKPAAFDLGTIMAGGALGLDSFSAEIPEGDYLVDERFTQPATVFTTSAESGGTLAASFAEHAHTIQRAGTVFRPLTAGDRVLCLILDADTDEPTPVVVGRIE